MAVRVMVACGVPQPAICQAVINDTTGKPVDAKTLRKVFREELNDGKQTANGLVAQSLFKKATGTGPQSVTAAIFWMKAQAGWRDNPEPADLAADVPAPTKVVFEVRDGRKEAASAGAQPPAG